MDDTLNEAAFLTATWDFGENALDTWTGCTEESWFVVERKDRPERCEVTSLTSGARIPLQKSKLP